MTRKHHNGRRLAASAFEAQAAMWVTLGVRVPQLLSGTMTAAEQHRMVAEKAAAMAESARDATLAAGRLALNPWILCSPAATIDAFTTVAAAAARPFQTRVTSNAKRLTKVSRGPSR